MKQIERQKKKKKKQRKIILKQKIIKMKMLMKKKNQFYYQGAVYEETCGAVLSLYPSKRQIDKSTTPAITDETTDNNKDIENNDNKND
eukprot:UN08443